MCSIGTIVYVQDTQRTMSQEEFIEKFRSAKNQGVCLQPEEIRQMMRDCGINLEALYAFHAKDRCLICHYEEKEMVIAICGHYCLCEICSKSMTNCPLCAQQFRQQQLIKVVPYCDDT